MRFSLKPVAIVLLLCGLISLQLVQALAANQSASARFERPAPGADTHIESILSAWENGELQTIALPAQIKGDTKPYRLLAQAFEAEGDVTKATTIYTKLLEGTLLSASERHMITLKLALLTNDLQTLTHIANAAPQLAYKLAKVIDIQSDNAHALPILQKVSVSSVPLKLTLATWLIESGEFREAEQIAWSAFNLADNSSDKHYALALYAEALRKSQSIERALAALSKFNDDPFLTPLYLDLLLEAGQIENALSLTEQSKLTAIRDQKIALLTLSGNEEGLVDYYRQLMLANPHEAEGYFGLAGQLVNRGDIAGAKQVFAALGENNPDNKSLLLSAASRMIAMNMRDDAIDMLTSDITDAHSDPQINFFLFETYLNSGDDAAAESILVQLSNTTAPDSPSRLLVVSGYESLNNPQKALLQLQNYQHHGGRLSYDQQLHLADLAKAAGEDEVAIAQWEALWQQVTLPARKYFLESLLVKATLEDGSRQRKVEQLEQALSADKLRLHELNLLVAFYLAENELAKAETAINTYSQRQSVPQKQRLELLANLFGRSHAYEKLNDVWRALAGIDPSNAPQYWQQITLNSLRNNAFDISNLQPGESPQAYRLAQVNQLIANLTDSGEASDPAFIASVYTMAGLPNKAIEQYRKALETQPSSDVLLQLTELYKKEGRIEQATRLLQQHLLTASSQTEYLAAVDGLLNLFDTSQQQGNENRFATLRYHTLNWLKRQLLARLVFAEADETELMLLADIAQIQGEFDTAERINNLILAQSAAQRATLLRSMITQFSGTDQHSASPGPTIGNEQKKLTYGRRLLALKFDFPPALYANLGRSLLADNDIAGAERAFSLMTEIPGILNVKQLKGDAYVSQHFDTTALNYFKEALQVDQSNFDLLRKTAVLEEQFDEQAIAGYWYWQGLKRLINQAPHYQAAYSNRRVSDSFRYFPTLSEGLLMTMAQQTNPQLVTDELKDMLEKSLQNIAPHAQVDTDINSYPRIAMIEELIQRIAFKQRSWADWQGTLTQIQRVFPNVKPVSQTLTLYESGLPDSAIKNLQAQAENDHNFSLLLALAVDQADWQALINLAAQLVQRIQVEGSINSMVGSNYVELVRAAVDNMPDNLFANRFWPTLSKNPQNDLLTFQLQRFLPDTFAQLEGKLGAPIFNDKQFVSLAIEHINTPSIAGVSSSNAEDTFNALLFSKISASELVRLWQNIERHFAQTNAAPPIRDEVVRRVMSAPIQPEQQQQVAGLLRHYITANKNGPAPCSAMAPKLMLLDIAKENQSLVLAEANEVALLSSQCAQLPRFLSHYLAGEKTQAYKALRALNKAATVGISYPVFEQVTRRYFSEERQAYIEGFFSTSPVSSQDAHQFIDEILPLENNVLVQQRYLETLHQRLPDDEVIIARLAHLLWQQKQFNELEEMIATSLPADANSDTQHLLFFLHAINRRTLPNEQRQVQQGQPISNVDSLVAWLNKSLSTGSENSTLASLYSLVFTEYAQLFPTDELVVALQSRQGGEQVAAPTRANTPDIARIVNTYRHNQHEAVRLLNTLWRNGIEGGQQFDGSALSREQLIHEFYDSDGHPSAMPVAKEDVLREMTAFAETSALFENWLTALPAQLRGLQQRLYNLVVAGWQVQGTIDSKVNDLLNTLSEPDFTPHDLRLLVSALPRSSVFASPQQLDLLQERALALQNASFYLRLGLADVFSRAGRFIEAGEWLVAAVWQINYPAFTLQTRVVQGRFNAPKLYDVVSLLSTWSNQQQATQLLANVIDISQPTFRQRPELRTYWQAFILQACAELGVQVDKVQRTFSTTELENEPVLTMARATYTRDVLNNTDSSVELVLSSIESYLNKELNGHYDRELDMLLSRLYGPQSPLNEQQTLMPWFSAIVDSGSGPWRLALYKQLSGSEKLKDKLAPYLTYLSQTM